MRKTVILSLFVGHFALLEPPAGRAETLAPTDDGYIDQTAQNTNHDFPAGSAPYGLLIKGQASNQRVAYAEFTLPDVTVTSAVLNFYHFRSWTAGTPTNDWNLQISGRPDSFDETLITWTTTSGTLRTGTWTDIGSALLMPGGLSGQDVNQWRVLSMTDFFNANKGTSVVIRFVNTDNNANKGGTIEDREGSRTGNTANAMYIEYTTEPVENQPPTAVLTACPTDGRTPLTVSFDASGSSDFDGTIINYHWDFDGNDVTDQTTQTPTIQHVYNSAGTFNAKVTVEDNDNAMTASTPVAITVTAGAPILLPVTAMLPDGGPLAGEQILTSITVGADTFTSLIGPPDASHIEIDGFAGDPAGLVGLDLNSATLGLQTTPGQFIRTYFDRPIGADGSDKPEIFVLEWADSRDAFDVQLLTNGPGEAPAVAATVSVLACHYAATSTILDVPGAGLPNQPVGGIAINLDALGVTNIRGVQIPSAGNSPGVDPCAIAAAVKPCPTPFADADEDQDVDLDDFAIFQRCHTGDGNTAAFDAGNCACFDSAPRDNDVDEFDLAEFIKCRTGPEIPWTQEATPDCVP